MARTARSILRIARAQSAAKKAKARASYLSSPRGLATETIKGLPGAARKVFLSAFPKTPTKTKTLIKKTNIQRSKRGLRSLRGTNWLK